MVGDVVQNYPDDCSISEEWSKSVKWYEAVDTRREGPKSLPLI